jgi:protein-L-isoaspartate(D-aspartate) O-methyltransferase
MPGDQRDSSSYRRELVNTLTREGHLHSPEVAAALLAVPREAFLPGLNLDEVYRPSDAIVTKRLGGQTVSSASAPEVIALMLEQLDPRAGDRVLEIGAGTGYNAALLAHLVGESGHVTTIDIDDDLVRAAREHLAACGFNEIDVLQGDGALGDPRLPVPRYERIILTVASSDIAPAWREQLLSPGGRLVMPLALRGLQRCTVFVAEGSQADPLVSRSLRNCSFIGLRGLLQLGGMRGPVGADGRWMLTGEDDRLPLPADVLTQLLSRPMRTIPLGISATADELRHGLHLWLAVHQPGLYTLWSGGRGPDLFGLAAAGGARGTLCLVDAARASLALLGRANVDADGGELGVLLSSGAEPLAERFRALIDGWVEAGRPGDADAEVRAFVPSDALEVDPWEAAAIDQRWTRFVVRWRRVQPPASLTV